MESEEFDGFGDQTYVNLPSRKVRYLRRHARMHRSRLTRVVDYMVDRAVISQRYSDHVVKPYPRTLVSQVRLTQVRRLDCTGHHYVRMLEDAVDAEPPRLMTRHSIRDFVRGPALHPRCTRIARLV